MKRIVAVLALATSLVAFAAPQDTGSAQTESNTTTTTKPSKSAKKSHTKSTTTKSKKSKKSTKTEKPAEGTTGGGDTGAQTNP